MALPLIAHPPIDVVVFCLNDTEDDAPAKYGFVGYCPGMSRSIGLGTDDDISSIDWENVHDFGCTHFSIIRAWTTDHPMAAHFPVSALRRSALTFSPGIG